MSSAIMIQRMPSLRNRSLPHRLLFLLLLGLALLNVVRGAENNRYVYGAGDLYVYWHAGQLVRQQVNPYARIDGEAIPRLPIQFLDGQRASRLPEPWTGLGIPTVTAPLILLFSLFSWFSWDVAKLAWMAANLAFSLLIPRLLLDLLPHGRQWAGPDRLLLTLLFISLGAVRSTWGNGQTSLLIFFLLLVTLRWATSRPLAAGVAFGIALAKYSLSLALLPVLILQRRWRLLAAALALQLLALLLLAGWSGTSPAAIAGAYVATLLQHAPLAGIHLSHAYPGPAGQLLTGVLGAGVPLLLFAWWRTRGRRQTGWPVARQLPLLAVLSIWILLIGYHGRYDAVVVLLFYGLILDRQIAPRSPTAGSDAARLPAVHLLALLSLVPMWLPVVFSPGYPPRPVAWWPPIHTALFAATLLGMLATLLWLHFSPRR